MALEGEGARVRSACLERLPLLQLYTEAHSVLRVAHSSRQGPVGLRAEATSTAGRRAASPGRCLPSPAPSHRPRVLATLPCMRMQLSLPVDGEKHSHPAPGVQGPLGLLLGYNCTLGFALGPQGFAWPSLPVGLPGQLSPAPSIVV